MKNTLNDLNNHLFAQLERLTSEDLTPEGMQQEIQRSKAVTSLAETIIHNGELALEVVKHADEYRKDGELTPIPEMLKGKKE